MKSYGVTIQMKPFLKVVTSKGAIHLSMETFRVMFTANGKREFVPGVQVFPLLVVFCSLLPQQSYLTVSR